jgi:hypothetical protein
MLFTAARRGPGGDIDISIAALSDVLTKHTPELEGERFAFLIQEKQYEDRERDDETVPSHELPDSLRETEESSRIGLLSPHLEGSRVCKLALPQTHPEPSQRHVLQPGRYRDSLLARGCDCLE